jgi:hypothetical protein
MPRIVPNRELYGLPSGAAEVNQSKLEQSDV